MKHAFAVLTEILVMSLTAVAPALAETLVTGDEVNKRGRTFTVAPYGPMKLAEIKTGGRTDSDCLVQIEGLKVAVANAIRDKSLRYKRNADETITITIDLQRTLDCKHPTSGERTPCCIGQGEGCTATVEVPKQVTGRVLNQLGV
jgi:hypothetical protein